MLYVWTKEINEYFKLLKLNAGSVPILLPEDTKRKKSWQKILNYYSRISKTQIIRIEPSKKKDVLLICFEDSFKSMAHAYGRLLKIPLNCQKDICQLQNFRISAKIKSVLIISELAKVGHQELSRIINSIKIPVSLLTGKDISGLSFSFAKAILAKFMSDSNSNNNSILKTQNDCIEYYTSKDKFIKKRQLSKQETLKSLQNIYHRTLAIFAHGESAHVNLKSVVLCGLNGEVEMFNNVEIKGCSNIDGDRCCKRVQDKDISIVYVSEIKCSSLFFFTCGSGVAQNSIYKSDIGTIKQISEGYVCSAFLSTGIIETDFDTAKSAMLLNQNNYSVLDIIQYLNDIHFYQSGYRPYFNFGIPVECVSFDHRHFKVVEIQNSIKILGSQNVFINLIEEKVPIIYDFRYPGLQNILITRSKSMLLAQNRNPKVMNISISNATEYVETIMRFLEKIILRIQQLEMHITNFTLLPMTEKIEKDIRTLNEDLGDINIRIMNTEVFCNLSLKKGIFCEYLTHSYDSLKQKMAIVDSKLINILLNKSLIDNLHEVLLRNMLVKSINYVFNICHNCEAQLIEKKYYSLFNKLKITYVRFCTLCGVAEINEYPKMGVYDISFNEKIIPNQFFTFQLNFSGEQKERNKVTVIIYMIDKGKNETIYVRKRGLISNSFIKFKIPHNITNDIHVLKIVVVKNLNISLFRFRIPAVVPK